MEPSSSAGKKVQVLFFADHIKAKAHNPLNQSELETNTKRMKNTCALSVLELLVLILLIGEKK